MFVTVEKKIMDSIIVTHNGANVVGPYTRLSCICHNLNIIRQDVFNIPEDSDIKDAWVRHFCILKIRMKIKTLK